MLSSRTNVLVADAAVVQLFTYGVNEQQFRVLTTDQPDNTFL